MFLARLVLLLYGLGNLGLKTPVLAQVSSSLAAFDVQGATFAETYKQSTTEIFVFREDDVRHRFRVSSVEALAICPRRLAYPARLEDLSVAELLAMYLKRKQTTVVRGNRAKKQFAQRPTLIYRMSLKQILSILQNTIKHDLDIAPQSRKKN
ncbi:hypothetical protein BDB00DRAFT_876130 [Zychaea mexicana]|uniref:uncharacterized protein n=1 Tax=Zychaea mexicana TaxID=64656 RepID=UPI0022FDB264|nr:uncharacterized protein BDB00DRAFT_876130 [Zychaea mexicana]KAI9489698.1 hypothetical protein BDB00DRAFT_876130 [Zychaea mexicana]